MSVQEIANLINNVGFPICVVLIAFWYINKEREDHKEETNNLREAINNNTLVMQQLLDKLSKN